MAKNIVDVLPKDSWVRDWVSCWPKSESPKSFIMLGALSVFGGALGRRVWFDQDVHLTWPMLNVLLIGPSGLGKSTAIKMSQKWLLDKLPKLDQPLFINGSTPEKLHEDLRANPHAILFASELANFFTKQKYQEAMVPYVTEMLDYPDKLQRRTKSGGVVEVIEPSVTVIGGSTVDWLQGQLPDSATSGGFLARFFILNEEQKGGKTALMKHELTKGQLVKLIEAREKVAERFCECILTANGEIEFSDYTAIDTYTQWYANHKPVNGHLAPFAARAGEFVLRLSMLIALSAKRNRITDADVKAGIAIYEYAASKLQAVVVPFTVQGKFMASILEAIGDGSLTDKEVMQAMRNFIPAIEVQKYIASLMQSGDLRRRPDGRYERVK
jgi:hypothetical protein